MSGGMMMGLGRLQKRISMILRVSVFFALSIFCLPSLAEAHGGRLDKKGCHNNRKTGEYHCHRGSSAPSVSTNKKALPALGTAQKPFSKYSNNVNVTRLGKYLSGNTTDLKGLSKTALFAGYVILYDVALKADGAEKLLGFSVECYTRAFLSNEMKNIGACYTAINVAVNQVERTRKVEIKETFDRLLIVGFAEQKITDQTLVREIMSQFHDRFQSEHSWISTLTVGQVSDCLTYGVGAKCKY